jgi:hypothetical protein
MTMTEARPTSKATAHTNGDTPEPTLADQIVLSSAAFATQGLNDSRRLVGGLLDAVDVLVRGVFDGADQLVRSNVVTDLATRAVEVARDAWSTAMSGVKESLTTS